MKLRHDIRIDEPYLLLNRWQRMHWAARRDYHRKLAWLIRAAIDPPKAPLAVCSIKVTRGNPKPFPDTDGLYGGLKPLLDCLVMPSKRNPLGLGFIVDDRPDVVMQLEAEAVKTKRGEGFTRIRIYGE